MDKNLTPAGIDIGYYATKVAQPDIGSFYTKSFMSVTGSADRSRFSIEGASQHVLTVRGRDYFVGKAAITSSRFKPRLENRDWINTESYYVLLCSALAALKNHNPKLKVVTGLPVNYFQADAPKLKEIFTGDHIFSIDSKMVKITVDECRVIPQPFGTMFDYVFNLDGSPNTDRANAFVGTVGIIDGGGNTTNIQTVVQGSDQSINSTSLDIGGWDIVRAVVQDIQDKHPDFDKPSHTVASDIVRGYTTHFGKRIDLADTIKEVSVEFVETIISQCTQSWGSGGNLDVVLISGGSSLMLGDLLASHFPQAVIMPNGQFSNAIGYTKAAMR